MHHHRDVGFFEIAAGEQSGLAAPRLLGGRAEEVDAPPVLFEQFAERRGRAEADRSDEIVPAGVTHAGQRVVLGDDAYRGAFAAAFMCHERRREPFDVAVDVEAFAQQ